MEGTVLKLIQKIESNKNPNLGPVELVIGDNSEIEESQSESKRRVH